jgi:3-hydroxymyristoyl/3-hydroxydecanoyl-(acyl carrier protein) dehydratase
MGCEFSEYASQYQTGKAQSLINMYQFLAIPNVKFQKPLVPVPKLKKHQINTMFILEAVTYTHTHS